jgi:GNAT superfamily N-acetyltransferase
MPEDFNMDEYKQDLNAQFLGGLISEEELAQALQILDRSNRSIKVSIDLERRPEDDEDVLRMKDLYYRTLFGRVQQEQDHKLVTDVIFGSVSGKPAGALWYAQSPTPDYRGCVYLDMLYVLEEFRGSGLGTNLLLGLLQQTPEDHCIITYAWKPSIDFYQRHGFLLADQAAEKEDEHFEKMVLPLTKKSFDKYCRRKGHGYLDGFEEMADFIKNPYPDFASDFVSAIANLSPEDEEDLSKNPFTAFIYQRAGLDHSLLK